MTVTIPEASQQFPQLMGRVLLGEEIIICENDIAVATITPSQRKCQPRDRRTRQNLYCSRL